MNGGLTREELLTALLDSGQEPDTIAELFQHLQTHDEVMVTPMEWQQGFEANLREAEMERHVEEALERERGSRVEHLVQQGIKRLTRWKLSLSWSTWHAIWSDEVHRCNLLKNSAVHKLARDAEAARKLGDEHYAARAYTAAAQAYTVSINALTESAGLVHTERVRKQLRADRMHTLVNRSAAWFKLGQTARAVLDANEALALADEECADLKAAAWLNFKALCKMRMLKRRWRWRSRRRSRRQWRRPCWRRRQRRWRRQQRRRCDAQPRKRQKKQRGSRGSLERGVRLSR